VISDYIYLRVLHPLIQFLPQPKIKPEVCCRKKKQKAGNIRQQSRCQQNDACDEDNQGVKYVLYGHFTLLKACPNPEHYLQPLKAGKVCAGGSAGMAPREAF